MEGHCRICHDALSIAARFSVRLQGLKSRVQERSVTGLPHRTLVNVKELRSKEQVWERYLGLSLVLQFGVIVATVVLRGNEGKVVFMEHGGILVWYMIMIYNHGTWWCIIVAVYVILS